MYGVQKGICYGQFDRTDELNNRIHDRQFSDKPLAPNFSSRPVMSKYSHFPIIERRAPYEEQIASVPQHDVNTNFSPATQNGPPSTYLNNIDIETGLRNQTVSHQRYGIQQTYVPNSDSDLYRVNVFSNSETTPQPHPSLFHHASTECTTRANTVRHINIGNELFHNNTRTQLRSLC
jgi:hypothetical protein